MSDFDSLTLAFEDWFDTPLCDLPDALRKRVEQEFSPMPWDDISAEQRRSVALQLDYQHDPAAAQNRRFWWDFFQRKDAVKEKIAEWEAVAAPTAGDLALKETKLTELRQELARMTARERQDRDDYYPAREGLDGKGAVASSSPGSSVQYVAYPKAMHQLTKQLGATPEELAAWVWLGGIAAYLNANELDPPPRFRYATGGDSQDYIGPLMACWFREDDIAQFEPSERYITGAALIERWGKKTGLHPESFIRAKIAESRLEDFHPIYGGTLGTFSEYPDFPPLTSGLFQLSKVEQIEAEDFAPDVERAEALSPPRQPKGIDDPGGAEQGTATGPCAVFLAMANLAASELSIAFVGDQAESGLGANNLLEISARGETRRVALAALDLVDRRRGGLNSQGAILLGMAREKKLTHTGSNAAKMKRLRDVFRTHLGVKGDPFEAYRKGAGWVPCFKITDKRGAADERARKDAERRTDSFEELSERGAQFTGALPAATDLDDESDDASAWLKKNDPDHAA